MKKRSGIHFLFLALLWGGWLSPAFAQPDSVSQADAEREVWQLSGLVVNRKTLDPVPYARLGVLHTRRTATCSEDGFYSIPVTLNDTLYFFSLGFKPTFFVIEDYMKSYQGDARSGYLYSINYLNEDSISLPTVTIYPWNTPTELRTAILETRTGHEDELAFARDNLDPQVMENLIRDMEVDGDERLVAARQAYYNKYMNQHIAPTVGLNPMAVIALLQYINQQTKEKKRKKDLNTWEE